MKRPPFTTWRHLKGCPVPPWDLCPEPWRWTEADPMTAEVETIEFLRALVSLLKPKVIVETGTYLGESAGMLALGCRDNGIGHVWSFDIKPECIEQAQKFLDVEELNEYVTLWCADARLAEWTKPIDLLFIDGGEDRKGELDHFAPFLTPRSVVAMHNAHDPCHIYGIEEVSDEWNRVLIPCPCGLYLMTRK